MATPQRPSQADLGQFRPRGGRARGLAALAGAALLAVALAIVYADRWRDRSAPAAADESGGSVPDPAPAVAAEPSGAASWRDALSRWFPGVAAPDLGPLRDLVDLARDPTAPLELRVGAVRWIARDDGREAFGILEDLLEGDAPSDLRAAVAEALGESPRREARPLLETLLRSDDESVARGALRGLARGPGAARTLEALLLDDERPAALRAEAAASLGALDTPEASAALSTALARLDDEWLVASVLDALGQHPFARGAGAFHAVLGNPALPREIKIEALEALGDSSPDAAALLMDYAARAPEAELRAAAVEAIAFLDDSEEIAPWLLRLVESEPSPDVRAEIYATLAFHARATYAATDAERLVNVILSETGGPARRQAFRLAAIILRAHPDARLAVAFDSSMVPWLRDEALRAPGRQQRIASLDTLELARTPGATAALERLAGSEDAALAEVARKALRGARAGELTAN